MTTAPVTEADVWETLSRVIDPELDCDIVALGLIYHVRIDGDRVGVTMTLTTPGCPMNELLPAAAKSLLEELPGVAEASVEVTWTPPWHFSRMSAVAREKLGLADDL
jgi:metal-sulfur cluster biosynthetic enzyme